MAMYVLDVPTTVVEEDETSSAHAQNLEFEAPQPREKTIPDEAAVRAPPPRPFPSELLLGTLGDARFRIIEPLHVRVSRENDDWIVEADELNEFGFGENPSAALRDLQRAVVELYLELDQNRERLGPELESLIDVLLRKLVRVA